MHPPKIWNYFKKQKQARGLAGWLAGRLAGRARTRSNYFKG
jgi:hypothetical protein